MTDPTLTEASLRPAVKWYPAEFRDCGDSIWSGTLIHELTQSKLVFQPVITDIIYASQRCKKVIGEKALLNENVLNLLGG
jgi:hypothetical protein